MLDKWIVRVAGLVALATAVAVLSDCKGNAGLPSAVPQPAEGLPDAISAQGKPPPASVATITPQPGFPRPPAPNRVMQTLPQPTTLPAPRVVTLALKASDKNLSGGISRAFARSIATHLPRPSPVTVVVGTIERFTKSGVTIADGAPIYANASEDPVMVVKLPAGPSLPSPITLQLSGKTLDGVPGGFAALRTGDSVLAMTDASAPPYAAAYLTDLSVLKRTLRPLPAIAEANAPEAIAPAAPAREPAVASGPGGATPFVLEGKTGPQPDLEVTGIPIMPRAGTNLQSIQLPFVSVRMTMDFILAQGSIANFPLALQDVSTPRSYVENANDVLPLSVSNRPSGGSATYSVNDYFAADVHIYAVLDPSIASKHLPGLPNSAQFSLSQAAGPKLSNGTVLMPGFGLQSGTTGTLPPPGRVRALGPVRGVGPSLDVAGALFDILKAEIPFWSKLLPNSPSFPVAAQIALNGKIDGGTVDGELSITNASPALISSIAFAPDAVPGSSQRVTPQAPPGAVRVNKVQFRSRGVPPYSGKVSLQADLAIVVGNAKVAVPEPIATYAPGPYAFANAVVAPQPVALTLTPSAKSTSPLCIAMIEGGDPVTGGSSSCSGTSTGTTAGGSVNSYICNAPVAPARCTSDESSSITVRIGEKGYSGTIDASEKKLPPSLAAIYGSALCGNGETYLNPISVEPDRGAGPQATFKVSAGPGVANGLQSCEVIFYDGSLNSAVLTLQMI